MIKQHNENDLLTNQAKTSKDFMKKAMYSVPLEKLYKVMCVPSLKTLTAPMSFEKFFNVEASTKTNNRSFLKRSTNTLIDYASIKMVSVSSKSSLLLQRRPNRGSAS